MAPTRVWTSHGTLIAASFDDMRDWEEESGRPDVVINLSTRSLGAASFKARHPIVSGVRLLVCRCLGGFSR